jgi:hypothetical protein
MPTSLASTASSLEQKLRSSSRPFHSSREPYKNDNSQSREIGTGCFFVSAFYFVGAPRRCGYLTGGHETFAAGAALGAEASATLGFAGLLVKLTYTNFFLDTATFHQLAKSANRLLSGFSFPKSQLYQGLLLTICRCLNLIACPTRGLKCYGQTRKIASATGSAKSGVL